MSNATKRWGRAGIASMATTALVASGLTAFAGAASASEPVDFNRIAGDNRYETSVKAAEAFGPTDNALLASGEQGHYVDALSGNFLAGVRTAPILLTREDRLPDAVKAHLESSTIDTITILGGELAVSAAVEAELEEMGITVNRLEGRNRYLTNEAIIDAGAAEAADTALIATGENFPDALGAGPVSYAGKMPVGLTKLNDIPDFVVQSLLDAGVDKALVLGGELAVSEDVVEELESKGIDVVDRLDGRNRSLTSIEVANWAIANLDFSDSEVDFASGRELSEGIDALSGGPVSGKEGVPILITVDENRAPQLVDYLEANAQRIDEGDIYGGPLAISVALEQQLEEAAEAEVTSNQDFAVTGQEAASNPASTSTSSNEGRREYSVAGLENDKTYRIELFPSENVTTDANGVVTFADANGDNLADDDGNTSARIETINGSATNQTDEQSASPVNGTITFTVDSTTTESVVPVIWVDADTAAGVASPDQELDLVAPAAANNNAKEPAEEFGVGGVKEWFVEATASNTQIGADADVTRVDKQANFFDAGGFRYFYDANDTFQIGDGAGCTTVSQAVFEAALSSGDQLDATSTYGDKGATPSTANDNSVLCIEDNNPDLTTGVSANRVNDTSVKVTISDDDADQDSFNIYRATAPVVNGVAQACPDFNTAGANNRGAFALVGNVAEDGNTTGEEESFTDTGLAAGTKYCYAVTAVNDGDESNTAATAESTTLAGGDTAEPVSQQAVVTNDEAANVFDEGTLSTGDVHRIVFDEAIDAPNANDTYRVVDAQGEFANIVNGGNATMTVNASTVTIDGQSYAAGRVLTVTITGGAGQNVAVGGDTDGNTGNNNGVINYPVTITQATGFTDADGDPAQWTPADDPDNVLEVNESAPGTTQVPPTMTDAEAVSDTSATVTLSEPVRAEGGTVDAGQFAYDADGTAGGEVPATGATISADGRTITLTFGAGTIADLNDADDRIVYNDDVDAATSDAGDVEDFDNNPLADEAEALGNDA